MKKVKAINKEKINETKPMFGYKVNINHNCYHSESDGEQYGSWSASYNNDFRGITPVNEYPDITSSLDIKVGEICYVVWAEWSSGDSFGRGDNSNKEAIAVFKDFECAKHLAETARDTKDYGFVLKTKDGQHHDVYCGWVGYFEYLSGVHIETTVMGTTGNKYTV